eukprot:scaffold54843_cov67-Phaeocystis_antarctica.AAC.8
MSSTRPPSSFCAFLKAISLPMRKDQCAPRLGLGLGLEGPVRADAAVLEVCVARLDGRADAPLDEGRGRAELGLDGDEHLVRGRVRGRVRVRVRDRVRVGVGVGVRVRVSTLSRTAGAATKSVGPSSPASPSCGGVVWSILSAVGVIVPGEP